MKIGRSYETAKHRGLAKAAAAAVAAVAIAVSCSPDGKSGVSSPITAPSSADTSPWQVLHYTGDGSPLLPPAIIHSTDAAGEALTSLATAFTDGGMDIETFNDSDDEEFSYGILLCMANGDLQVTRASRISITDRRFRGDIEQYDAQTPGVTDMCQNGITQAEAQAAANIYFGPPGKVVAGTTTQLS